MSRLPSAESSRAAGQDGGPHTLESAREVLWRHWRHPDFRAGQREIVESVISGRDTLAVLPTGGGKSVCYQVPAVLFGGLTIVVSPLIALMQDQVAGLRARGIGATFINSHLSHREIEQRWIDAEYGLHRLLYVAPERFRTETFRARAERLDVRLIAVDEAHCISEWGPDFRPAYFEIAEAAELLRRPPIVAVTATATPEVRSDIVARLGLRVPHVMVAGFDRPNVVPSVFHTSAKHEKLDEVLHAVPGSAIVYVSARATAEALAARLAGDGISAAAYHAGLPAGERMIAQERWQAGERRVVVATNAFGMGIDKPDVRLVLHYDVPLSLEAYYQEAGRAGRDGDTSYAVLLFGEGDAAEAKSFVEQARPDRQALQAVYDAAMDVIPLAVGSPREEPFVFDATQIGSMTGLAPMTVRASAELLSQKGIWDEVRMGRGNGLVRLLKSPAELRRYAEGSNNPSLSAFITELLRVLPPAAASCWAELDMRQLERRLELTVSRLLRGLEFLRQRELLAYQAPGDARYYRLNEPRASRVPVDGAELHRNRKRADKRLADMLRYARSISCRRHFLLTYFGEAAAPSCGSCDICLGRHRPAVVSTDDEHHLRQILEQVADGRAAHEWLAAANLPTHRILGLGDWLANEGLIELRDPLNEAYALTEAGRRFLQ